MVVIQIARRNKNAFILLEELEMEKTKELKKASAACRKIKKKMKKQAKSGKKLEGKTEDKNKNQENEEVPVKEMMKKVDLKKKGKVTNLSSVILADVEEDDSGIDANNQGSCSNTDAKNAREHEEGWKEVVRTRYLASPYRSKKILVPLNAISRVIGRGGSNINAIRASTGALIEVDNQSKGQGERIINIKGSTNVTIQAHDLIAILIKDPKVNIMSIIGKNPKVTSAWNKSLKNAKTKTVAALQQKPIDSRAITVTASKLIPAPLVSMTIKRTIIVNESRHTFAAIVAGKKKITSTIKPIMSFANVIISTSDPVSKPSQQSSTAPPKVVQSVTVTPATAAVTLPLKPTASGSASTSASTIITKSTNAVTFAQSKPQQAPSIPHHQIATVSHMVSSALLSHQPQMKPQVIYTSEYSLFDPFSKLSFPTLWGRNGECGRQKPTATFSGGNQMPVVTPSILTISRPKKYLEAEPPMADPSKAPGY